MNIKFTLISLMTTVGLSASAISVTSTSGNLSTVVGENIDATSLEISGEINAADLDFIAKKMTSLSTLDMSNAKIGAYSGAPILLGKTEYNANSLPAYSLAGTSIQSIILPKTLQIIEDGALSSTKITSISIPESVTSIGMGAFTNCDELATITIPSNVTSLGSYAFSGCDKLTSATLYVTYLGESTFEHCVALKSITAPSLLTIGDAAFNNCSALEEFNFANTLRAIGNNAFQNSGLKSIDFTNTSLLESIGAWAFAQCSNLTSAIMNDKITTIGEGAFFDNINLSTFNMPLACTVASEYVLKGNTSIDTTNMLNDNVSRIEKYALMGMNHLTTFTLPGALNYIGDNAFEGWTSLTKLNAENIVSEVPALGNTVWNGIDQSKVELVASQELLNQYPLYDQWCEFKISGVSSVEDIAIETSADVRAYFVGYDLVVEAGQEIAMVSIYDSSARQYGIETNGGSQVTINTSDWNCRLYIVKVILADGNATTIKIARNN